MGSSRRPQKTTRAILNNLEKNPKSGSKTSSAYERLMNKIVNIKTNNPLFGQSPVDCLQK
jgi:hypothetical protein